jgi:polar amino acid transport system substrate-binding protein
VAAISKDCAATEWSSGGSATVWGRRAGLALLLIGTAGLAGAAPAAADVLRGGWYPWDPYQYTESRRGVAVLTGFDVEIERAIARLLGVELALADRPWRQHLEALAAGEADIAAGATYSAARNAFAYFSKPYRRETDVLILPRGASARYPFRTVDGMLEPFASQHFRLGAIAGYIYADPRVNAYIADPAHRDLVVAVGDDSENLQNLLDRRIDGFIADRIVAATVAWRRQKSALIEEHPLRFSTDIHFMLSRQSQSPAMLARLNDAIDQIKRSGEYQRIADAYALPVLINQTLDADWFHALVLLGTVAFALSGVVLAYSGRYTLFGAVILGSLPAVGGGVVRDVLLQREPVGIVRDPATLLTVFGTVLAGMAVVRTMAWAGIRRFALGLQSRRGLGTLLIQIFDAVGLAAFIVVGVVVVLDTSAEPLWLWGPVSAAMTGSFGGLMRDLFRHDREVVSLKGELYPEIAVVWGLALSLFLGWEAERLQPEEILLAVVVTIVGAFLTRIAAILFGLKGWSYA